MFNLSVDQIAKLRQSINSEDERTVRDCLNLLFPARSGEFVAALARVAENNPDVAEELSMFAIVLYAKYFPDEHPGGLSAMCALTRLLESQNRHEEIQKFIDDAYPMVIRAARALGKLNEEAGANGKQAARTVLNKCAVSERL